LQIEEFFEEFLQHVSGTSRGVGGETPTKAELETLEKGYLYSGEKLRERVRGSEVAQ